MLVVIGGLPATGKTTLARLLAAETGAVHLRVDTIEQALVRSGLARHPVGPAGYAVGYALAEEQLRQGLTVIAESVNPLGVTRDAWRDTALFIVPPFEFRIVSAMITNFHLPRSSLLFLVSALAGREQILAAYEEEVREGYRFYSYGDAMLIAA